MDKRRILKLLASAAVCLWGLWMLHGVMFSSETPRVQGDLGDARFNNLVLEHNHHFLSRQWPGTYWDLPWMFYPFEKGLALSDIMTGNAVIYSPLRWLGLDPIEAYQGWFVLCSLLNFGSFLVLMRVARISWWPSLVGAFLFAFSLPRNGFLMHAQLLPQFPTILSLACFLKYTQEPETAPKRALWLLLAAFGFAFQFWAGFYLWWFFFFGILLALFFAAFQPRLMKPLIGDIVSHPLRWVSAGALALAMLVPFALEYVAMQNLMGRREYSGIIQYLPKAKAYLYPTADSYFYAHLFHQNSSLSHETRMFLGFGVLGAMFLSPLVAWFERRRREVDTPAINWRVALICFLLMAAVIDLSLLRDSGYSLWQYVYTFIPGAGALRAVGRIVILLLIPGSILVAYCLNSLHLRRSRWALVISAALGIAIIVEQSGTNQYAFSRPEHEARIAKVATLYEKERESGKECELFYFKDAGPRASTHIDAMWYSLAHEVPTVNGYSGNEPKPWRDAGLFGPESADLAKVKTWLDASGKANEKVCLLDGGAPMQAAAR